jgi:hypothetical protein
VTKNDATTEVHLDSSFNVGGGPGSGRHAAEWFEVPYGPAISG